MTRGMNEDRSSLAIKFCVVFVTFQIVIVTEDRRLPAVLSNGNPVTQQSSRPARPGCFIADRRYVHAELGCVPMNVTQKFCDGRCPSESYPTFHIRLTSLNEASNYENEGQETTKRFRITSRASCCRMIDSVMKEYKLNCTGGENRTNSVIHAVKCKCDDCYKSTP